MRFFLRAFTDLSFKGRVSRRAFCWFYFITLPLILFTYFLFTSFVIRYFDQVGVASIVMCIPLFVLGLPTLSMQCKRLHDIGKSEWWLLLSLIPYLGSLVLLYWLLIKKGDACPNRYGPVPADDSADSLSANTSTHTGKKSSGTKGLVRIILGCIFIFLQILSILGGVKIGNPLPELHFANIELFFYSLCNVFGYYCIGIAGLILFLSGSRAYRRSKNAATPPEGTAIAEQSAVPVESVSSRESVVGIPVLQETPDVNHPSECECKRCGKPLLADAEFCGYCGSRIEEEDSASVLAWQVMGSDIKLKKSDAVKEPEVAIEPELYCLERPEATKVEEQGSPYARYCSKCGNGIDPVTKICAGCGKQYFKGLPWKKIRVVLVFVLITVSIGLNVYIYSIYDVAQESLGIAHETITILTKKNNELENDAAKLRLNISALNKSLREYQDLADFCDEYVVFVRDDGTDLYHKFACDRFQNQSKSFWAFNISAAKNKGHTPCPNCCN